MLKCIKCKTPVDDASDGCSVCKEFKKKKLFRDAGDDDDSIPGQLNDSRKLLRNHIKHLQHVHKMQLRKGADEYDPKLIDSMVKLSKALNDVCAMMRKIQGDARRQLMAMNGEERLRLLAKALAEMPELDRVRVLELTQDPKIIDIPVLSPYHTDN